MSSISFIAGIKEASKPLATSATFFRLLIAGCETRDVEGELFIASEGVRLSMDVWKMSRKKNR